MKSSSPRPELFRTLLHPAISVTVSTSAVLAALSLMARLAGVSGPRGLTVAAVIVAPLVEAAVGNLLYSERAGIGNRVRELVIYLLLAYAVFSLVRPGPFAARFVPSSVQALPLIAAGIAWLHAFAIHNRLRGREGLLRAFHGKHGDLLRHALMDRQHEMALTVRELSRAQATVVGGFLFLCGLAVVAATGIFTAGNLPASSWAFILLCANGAVSALALGALNTFVDEYAANGVGLGVPFRFQRRRLVIGLVVVLAALAGAFALSRRESLLPLESLAAFFRWFGGLFDRERAPLLPQPTPQQTSSPAQDEMLRRMPAGMEPTEPALWIRLPAQLVRRLVVAGVSAAIAVLIFGPLFSPAFRTGLKQIRPGQMLKALLSRFRRHATVLTWWFRAGVRRWFRGRRAETLARGVDERPFEAGAAATEPKWRPSILKRRQMDRVVAVFAAVAKWGPGSTSAEWQNFFRNVSVRRRFAPEHSGKRDTVVTSCR